jgi:hypothetical protein
MFHFTGAKLSLSRLVSAQLGLADAIELVARVAAACSDGERSSMRSSMMMMPRLLILNVQA